MILCTIKAVEKKMVNSVKEELLEIREFNQSTMEHYKREGVSVLDFSGLGENRHFFYLVQKEGKRTAYILDCPEKLLKEMKIYSRDKWM